MSFRPSVFYQDPKAALAWLAKAFGFETELVVEAPDGELVFSEMRFGDGRVIVRGKSLPWRKSPRDVGGANTQYIEVNVEKEIDAHCERARAAGAVIAFGPETQPYGERAYHAVDPEGHVWGFSQIVRDVPDAEWEKEMGLKSRRSL
jgi:uncharacterized glyoxalase superfamily protein PhnB